MKATADPPRRLAMVEFLELSVNEGMYSRVRTSRPSNSRHFQSKLFHHASKKQRAQPGQALRGSSDLHAFGDSNAYPARGKHRLTLTLEHRSARPPDPFMVELKTEPSGAVYLALANAFPNPDLDLPQRVLSLLRHRNRPMPANEIRAEVRAQGQRLANTLKEMAAAGLIHQPTRKGWVIGATPTAPANSFTARVANNFGRCLMDIEARPAECYLTAIFQVCQPQSFAAFTLKRFA